MSKTIDQELDLSIFEMTDSAVFVQLRHPKTGVLLEDKDGPVGVEVFGADSEVFKKHQYQLQNETTDSIIKRRSALQAEAFDERALSTLADCISSLRNIKWKGEVLESPKDNKRFLKLMPWARDQIDEAMADRARFMPALPKT